MFIRQLELRNFRCYDHLVLNFDQPRTLFIGENGVGKSTVADAIALLLTGQCTGTNRKGDGQRELIRTGADEAMIKLTIDGHEPFIRWINEKQGTKTSHPVDMILGRLRTTEQMATAVCYGHTFFDLEHAAAKGLLMRLLDVKVALQLDGEDQILALDDIDAKYKTAFEDRATAKRLLQGHHVPDVQRRVDLEHLDADDLDLQIDRARVTYEAAVNATAEARARVKQLKAERPGLEGKLAVSIDTLQTKVQTHRDMLTQHQQQLTEARAALAALEAEPAEPVQTLAAEVQELKVFVQRVEVHAKPAGDKVAAAHCVLGSNIPCLTPAKEFQDQLKATKKKITDLEKRIKAGNKRAADLGAANQAVKDADRHVTYHDGQITALQQQLDTRAEAAEQLAAVTAELDELEPETTAGDQAIAEASGTLAALQAKQRELDAYQGAMKNRERALEQHALLQQDVADLEAKVTLLGPKGARATALQSSVDDFHAAINAALAPFGFQMAISVDPWQVRVKHPQTKTPLPYALLSKGQRLWTGLAFQLALAAVSGLEFAIVDDTEAVVGHAMQTLTRLVMVAPIGQILILKAAPASAEPPAIDGLQVIQVGKQLVTA